MVLSPDIIDKDLIFDKNLENIEDIFNKEKEKNGEEIYEPTTLTAVKDVIVDASQIKSKEKPTVFHIIKYKVKEGESLWTIAKNNDISINTILFFNPKLSNNIIYENMELDLPNMDGILVTLNKNETLDSIAKNYKIKTEELIKVNNIKNVKELKAGDKIFVPGTNLRPLKTPQIKRYTKKKKEFELPVKAGYISSTFGNRFHPIYRRWIFHEGIDIASNVGTKIYSVADGKVTFVGWIRGYGRVIIIRHTKGFTSTYAHLNTTKAKIGDWVEQGELIGYMGNTGRVTGSHLHFELRRFGQSLNPAKYIDFSKLLY